MALLYMENEYRKMIQRMKKVMWLLKFLGKFTMFHCEVL
jgi:hypothetical protein